MVCGDRRIWIWSPLAALAKVCMSKFTVMSFPRLISITISCRARGTELAIAVADEGGGIPADALERIFDRFARADSARSRAQGGVGLGLAIVDALVRAHGGRCEAANRAGGAVFTLRLPGFVRKVVPAVGESGYSGALNVSQAPGLPLR